MAVPEELDRNRIQKILDENSQLIQVILDYQNKGRAQDCFQYQRMLHRNLLYLTSIADADLQSHLVQSNQVHNTCETVDSNEAVRQTQLAAATSSSSTSISSLSSSSSVHLNQEKTIMPIPNQTTLYRPNYPVVNSNQQAAVAAANISNITTPRLTNQERSTIRMQNYHTTGNITNATSQLSNQESPLSTPTQSINNSRQNYSIGNNNPTQQNISDVVTTATLPQRQQQNINYQQFQYRT